MVEHSQILKTNDFLSYRTLIWRRFRKNRMGIIALVILGIFYFSAVFAEYFAPYDHKEIQIHMRHVPPQKIYYNLSDGLYVHGLITTKNPKTLELEYKKNHELLSDDGFKEVMSKVQEAHPRANLSRYT